MHLTTLAGPRRPAAGGFSLLESVIAAGLLLATVTAVTLCVASVTRAGQRVERSMVADRAVRAVAERLRSLPFCAASYPAVSAGVEPSDLVAAVFPHALAARNTATARYEDGSSGPAADAGSFVTLAEHGGVTVTCVAWFLAGPDGPRLGPADIVGWDAASVAEPPAPVLEVVVRAGAPGGDRTVHLVLVALCPSFAARPGAGAE